MFCVETKVLSAMINFHQINVEETNTSALIQDHKFIQSAHETRLKIANLAMRAIKIPQIFQPYNQEAAAEKKNPIKHL